MNDMQRKKPIVYSVKDLCELLNISHNTAYMLVRSNQIKNIKLGRRYLIPHAAVDEYLKTDHSM